MENPEWNQSGVTVCGGEIYATPLTTLFEFCALLGQFWNYLLINWPICVSNVSCSVLNSFSVNLYEYCHICNCLA